MIELLSMLEAEKDNWIYDAIDVFDEGFLRFDGKKYDKDQVLIGIYGPTQVGKTTLILTLLGIGDEYISNLSNALRGKRQKGNSSTITSFIYKKSEDENFYLTFPNKERACCKNLLELEENLQTIRAQIEAGAVTFDKPIILDIAKTFFTNEMFAEKSRNISIIDLPGDDTREKREELYVEHILNTYLPFCSVCILMEISSKIVRLFQLKRPSVMDWMHYPQTFRLVLSRSLQSSSIKRKIEHGEIQSLEDFRKHYQIQLENNHSVPNKIFPLEFGDTWVELKKRNDVVFQKANEWIQKLFQELLDELSAAKTPENQIMQIKNMGFSIRKQRNSELAKMEKRLEQIDEVIQRESKSCENVDTTIGFLKEEVLIFQKGIDALAEIKVGHVPYHLEDHFQFKEGSVITKDRKTDKLKNAYQFLELELLRAYEKKMHGAVEALKRLMLGVDLTPKLVFGTNPPVVMLELEHDRGLNQYLFHGNFKEDYSIVEKTLSQNDSIIKSYYRQQLKVLKETCLTQLRGCLMEKESLIWASEDQLVEKTESITELEELQQALKHERETAIKEWNQDLERPLKLDEILKSEFLKAFTKLKSGLLAPDLSEPEKWAYHQYSQILLNQAERIIGNDYF